MSHAQSASATAAMEAFDRLRRPVWMFDPVNFRGVYANRAALALWGAQTREELLARDFSNLSPAVRARTDNLAQATLGGRSVDERWTFYPNGEPVTVQAEISAFDIGVGHNVLLFEAAPMEVGEDERRAVEALRHTSSLITLFDASGAALFANPAAFAAYGDPKLAFEARFMERACGATAFARAAAGEIIEDLQQVLTLQGERWHFIDARMVTDPVTGGVGVLLNEQDVTAQIEAEREAAAAGQRADLAMAKQRFLANMSHELRTPLTTVLGFSGLLEAGSLDRQQREHVQRISAAGTTLLGAVNDIILMSEIDSGEVVLKAESFDPAAILEDALVSCAVEAEGKGIELAMDLDLPGDALAVGDAERVRTVLQHFAANAVKFTPRGTVTGHAAGRVEDGVLKLEFSVRDTGPGVDPAAVAGLFERFSQGDMSQTKRIGGGGLGLAICHELAGLMGGQVGCDSTPGQGALFWLRLDLPAEARAVEETAQAAPLRVLYADDHENNRVLVQAMLATQGHDCDLVCDGSQAVEAAGRGGYDLILMDIQMPVMDGVAATRAIRAAGGEAGEVPILALTANTLGEQLIEYEAAGMNDCIAKPVDMVELLTKVAGWARSAEARAAA